MICVTSYINIDSLMKRHCIYFFEKFIMSKTIRLLTFVINYFDVQMLNYLLKKVKIFLKILLFHDNLCMDKTLA